MSKMGAYVLELQTQQENAEYVHSRADSNTRHRNKSSMGSHLDGSGTLQQWDDYCVQLSWRTTPRSQWRGRRDGTQVKRRRAT